MPYGDYRDANITLITKSGQWADEQGALLDAARRAFRGAVSIHVAGEASGRTVGFAEWVRI